MRYLSLFSGIEAASVAWKPLKWDCVGVAEIEPFPCKVLAHHYPDVPNLGSVTDITEEQIEALKPIDLVVYGFPCQDLSVAGKRKGLHDADGNVTRSGLFYKAAEIIEWSGARLSVAENVPGLLSSRKGLDFAAVVGELSGREIPVPRAGWANAGFASGPSGLVEWGVLDAQGVRVPGFPRAVPQRRRRIFIVRDTGNWQSRPPLLLVAEGLRGDIEESRKKRQGVASSAEGGVRGGSHWDGLEVHPSLTQSNNAGGIAMSNQEIFSQRGAGLVRSPTVIGRAGAPEVSNSISASDYKTAKPERSQGAPLIPEISTHRMVAFGEYDDDGKASSIKARDHKDATDLVCEPLLYENHPNDSRVTGPHDTCPAVVSRYGTGGGNVPLVQEVQGQVDWRTANADEGAVAQTLKTDLAHQSGPCICLQGGGTTSQRSQGSGINIEKSFTLNAIDKHAVCFEPGILKREGGDSRLSEEVCSTLRAEMGDNQPAVCFEARQDPICHDEVTHSIGAKDTGHGICWQQNTRDEVRLIGGEGDITGALMAQPGMKQQNYIMSSAQVRRLTPTECERLQGFPDGYTLIPYKGFFPDESPKCPDGPRYKALGNSMAVNVMRWIGMRIDAMNKEEMRGHE